MATTNFGSLSAAKKQIWANEVVRAGLDESFWNANGFVGSGTADMSRPVHNITDITTTERGALAYMQLVAELQGDGVVGNNRLTGNEESLVNDIIQIQVDWLRNGVKSEGPMAEQDTVVRFRIMAKEKLAYWLADTVDELMFLTAAGKAYTLNTDGSTRTSSQLPQLRFAADVAAATTNRIMFSGTATAENNVATSDTVTWDTILTAVTRAKVKRIKPIRYQGKSYYVAVLSEESARDLKKSSDYKNILQNAGPRGMDNPLFKSALMVTPDGVVLHSHPKVYNTKGLGSGSKFGGAGTVDGAYNMLLGAQALGFAQTTEPKWNEADQTDYDHQPGVSYGGMYGMVKPQFKSGYDSNSREDFGIITIKSAAAV